MKRQQDEMGAGQSAPRTASERSGHSRRGFLQTVGVGTAALGALPVAGAASSSSKPRLVFIYDDGYRADYTQTFSVHQKMDAPACAALPSSVLGRSEEFLTPEQLTEMSDAGWEVMSHGVSHEALGAVKLTQGVESGDSRLYVESTVHARTPHEVEILQGDKRVVRKLAGKGEDDTGSYVELKSAVKQSFDAGARMRFTEEVIRSVLSDSKKSLEKQGFDVSNLVLPYGRHDDRTLSLVKDYYDSVANVQSGGINPGEALQPYRLQRAYFRTDVMSKEELTGFMDRVASRNALGILGGHSRNPNLTGERIQLAIKLAQERDIEIVTLSTALAELGITDGKTSGESSPSNESSPSDESESGNETADRNGSDSGGSALDSFFDWLLSLFS